MLKKDKIATPITIIFAAILVVALFNPMSFTVEAFQFTAKLELPSRGTSTIAFPPLGSISAHTHSTPVGLRLTLEGIDLDLLGAMLEQGKNKEELVVLAKTEGRLVLRQFIVRMLLLAFIGGLLGAFLVGKNTPIDYLRAGVAGLLSMLLLTVLTLGSFQGDRFTSPQFNGALKAAPWMIDLAEKGLAKVEDIGVQLQVMVGNLNSVFEGMEAAELMDGIKSDMRILHVSDIHNNLAAFDLIEQIVNNFEVDFIIDTGDLSDYGTVLEGLLAKNLDVLQVPYVFIPGNHDSPSTLEALGKTRNVTVLDEEIAEIKGIKIFGLADSASQNFNLINPSGEKFSGHLAEISTLLNKAKVDIIAVHRPNIAKGLAGLAPLILHGHTHRSSLSEYHNSVLINAGSSGAAGIRRLQASSEVPFSLVLLHLNHENGKWLPAAADVMNFFEGSRRFNLERTLLTR